VPPPRLSRPTCVETARPALDYTPQRPHRGSDVPPASDRGASRPLPEHAPSSSATRRRSSSTRWPRCEVPPHVRREPRLVGQLVTHRLQETRRRRARVTLGRPLSPTSTSLAKKGHSAPREPASPCCRTRRYKRGGSDVGGVSRRRREWADVPCAANTFSAAMSSRSRFCRCITAALSDSITST